MIVLPVNYIPTTARPSGTGYYKTVLNLLVIHYTDSNILSMAGACIEFGQMSLTRYQDS